MDTQQLYEQQLRNAYGDYESPGPNVATEIAAVEAEAVDANYLNAMKKIKERDYQNRMEQYISENMGQGGRRRSRRRTRTNTKQRRSSKKVRTRTKRRRSSKKVRTRTKRR